MTFGYEFTGVAEEIGDEVEEPNSAEYLKMQVTTEGGRRYG